MLIIWILYCWSLVPLAFFCPYCFRYCLKECVWFKNLLLLKSDINPKHFSFFAIDFNISNKLSPIPRGYQSFKDFRPSPQFIPNTSPPPPVYYVLSNFSILPPHPPFILTPSYEARHSRVLSILLLFIRQHNFSHVVSEKNYHGQNNLLSYVFQLSFAGYKNYVHFCNYKFFLDCKSQCPCHNGNWFRCSKEVT